MKDTEIEQTSGDVILKKETDTVLEIGPLESVFPGSVSKILDFLVTFRDYDYSISDVSKNSGVGFKTTLNEIHRLEDQGVVQNTRTVGKAIMYKLNPVSNQVKSIKNLAMDIATRRMEEKEESAPQNLEGINEFDELKQAKFSLQQKKIKEGM